MSQTLWTDVDRYFEQHLLAPDPTLDAALRASGDAGLPAIQVAANQGKLLQLLALAIGAQRVLEIGTLGGYSTIWLARALPAGGVVVTLEVDAKHAEVARANIERAGLAPRVDLRVGRALDTLPQFENDEPFDLVFIDADKPSNADYFDWALKLSHPGSLIVVDNVARDGAVIDANSRDASVSGTRRLVERVGSEARVSATALQTVGGKGHDGLLIALVVAETALPAEPD
jgi:predicted O-methyltransferase YrrM